MAVRAKQDNSVLLPIAGDFGIEPARTCPIFERAALSRNVVKLQRGGVRKSTLSASAAVDAQRCYANLDLAGPASTSPFSFIDITPQVAVVFAQRSASPLSRCSWLAAANAQPTLVTMDEKPLMPLTFSVPFYVGGQSAAGLRTKSRVLVLACERSSTRLASVLTGSGAAQPRAISVGVAGSSSLRSRERAAARLTDILKRHSMVLSSGAAPGVYQHRPAPLRSIIPHNRAES
jgi:hypothetical protein